MQVAECLGITSYTFSAYGGFMFTHDALAGKHALICGASKGIGQACALAMAKAGARVTVLARQLEGLEATVSMLEGTRGRHRAVCCDMSDLTQVQTAIKEIGPDVDIVLCNSGGPAPGPLQGASLEALEGAFCQHVLANTLLVQAFIPHMREKRYGRIINIISTSVKIPLPNLGVSNTIRGAVASWAKTLANELGPSGITVNNVLPGYTKTQRLEQIIQNAMAKTGKTKAEVEQGFLADVPAQRFAEASELAAACTFLASDAASYINGINLPVDGGRTGCL